MTKETATLEVTAPTIEEAIEKGLEELKVEREDVEVEVLDEGKRNLFRFASKQARVKLTIIDRNAVRKETSKSEPEEENLSFGELFEAETKSDVSKPVDIDKTDVNDVVEETVRVLLSKMDVQATVTSRMVHQEDEDRDVVYVNIEGSDLSFLIGRRAETLNALQSVTSLMVNKKLNQWVPLQLDVQNFRHRREVELQKLARRMAEQVVSSGRKQCLEPMPANERRIVHIELRKNELVYTESVGEEPNRKICIYPAG